jgi:hypothetical protein
MLNALHQLWRLPLREKARLFGVWWGVLRVDLEIRFLPSRVWRSAVRVAAHGSRLSREEIERWAWRARVVGSHHLYPIRCLARAVWLQRKLRRLGQDAELKIGVRRERSGLEAHAWVEVDGSPVGESPALDRQFTVLAPPHQTAKAG